MWHARPRSPRATPSRSQKTTTWTRSSAPAESRCDTPTRRARESPKNRPLQGLSRRPLQGRVTCQNADSQKINKRISKKSGKVQGATHCPVAGPSGKLNAHFAVPLNQEVLFGRSLQSHSLLASGHDLGKGVSKPPHPIAQGVVTRGHQTTPRTRQQGERVFRPNLLTPPPEAYEF